MINSRFLERLGDRRIHPVSFSQKKGLEDSSFRGKRMFIVGCWKVILDFLLKLLAKE